MNLIYKPFFHQGIMIGTGASNPIMMTPGVVLVRVLVHHGMTSLHSNLSRTFVSVHEVWILMIQRELYSGDSGSGPYFIKLIGPNSQRRFVDKPPFVSTNLLLLFTNQVCKKRVKTRHMTYINLGLSTNLLCEFGPWSLDHVGKG